MKVTVLFHIPFHKNDNLRMTDKHNITKQLFYCLEIFLSTKIQCDLLTTPDEHKNEFDWKEA